MAGRLEVAFCVELVAWCRDCGAKLDEGAYERPDGPVQWATSDRGGPVALVMQRGACAACGGGRVAVKVDVGMGPDGGS